LLIVANWTIYVVAKEIHTRNGGQIWGDVEYYCSYWWPVFQVSIETFFLLASLFVVWYVLRKDDKKRTNELYMAVHIFFLILLLVACVWQFKDGNMFSIYLFASLRTLLELVIAAIMSMTVFKPRNKF
jgi:hypothetical protein